MSIKKMSKYPQAEIGIFGGSGFYSLFDKAEEIVVKTPYGAPSDKISVAEIVGRRVAFLPRHGRRHQFPPHKIPYLANLWAMKELGVSRIIAPTACGSLKADIKPGEFVICDQFVDRTKNRPDTFFAGPKIVHISCAEPYCPQMRELAVVACKKLKIAAHKHGTVVVVEGPRFSTKAESRWLGAAGASVINMTQYPEVVLARELEICYVNISLITDYDAGLSRTQSRGLPRLAPTCPELCRGNSVEGAQARGQKNVKAVDAKTVKKVFAQNIERVRELIVEMVKNMPAQRTCECGRALAEAEF